MERDVLVRENAVMREYIRLQSLCLGLGKEGLGAASLGQQRACTWDGRRITLCCRIHMTGLLWSMLLTGASLMGPGHWHV